MEHLDNIKDKVLHSEALIGEAKQMMLTDIINAIYKLDDERIFLKERILLRRYSGNDVYALGFAIDEYENLYLLTNVGRMRLGAISFYELYNVYLALENESKN